MGFEDFLAQADRAGMSDPGSAMVSVLERNAVRGIDLRRILSDPSLDPRNNPRNVVPFLRRIASDGQWNVNLSVRVW
jgi:hypothetical protein